LRRNIVLTLAVLVAVIAGFVVYVDRTSPSWYERIRYPLRYSEYVRVHAAEHGLDPALVAAVIYQESKFRASVVSSSGAIGLMQLTPATARGIAIRTGGSKFRTQDLFNPEGNVDRWRSAGEGIQFPETRAYVKRVEHLTSIYRRAWHSKLYPSRQSAPVTVTA